MATVELKPKTQKPRLLESGISPLPVKRFSLGEYHLMIATGILKPGDPYELLHGWIIQKMPIDSTHSCAVSALADSLKARIPKGMCIRTQQPISFGESEPEPDLCIAVGIHKDYHGRHPTPEECELVVEVSNTSLAVDSGSKLDSYAKVGIGQYWIVNLIDEIVVVYTQPRGGKKPGYKSCVPYSKSDEIPLVLAGKKVGTLPVNEFLA